MCVKTRVARGTRDLNLVTYVASRPGVTLSLHCAQYPLGELEYELIPAEVVKWKRVFHFP